MLGLTKWTLFLPFEMQQLCNLCSLVKATPWMVHTKNLHFWGPNRWFSFSATFEPTVGCYSFLGGGFELSNWDIPWTFRHGFHASQNCEDQLSWYNIFSLLAVLILTCAQWNSYVKCFFVTTVALQRNFVSSVFFALSKYSHTRTHSTPGLSFGCLTTFNTAFGIYPSLGISKILVRFVTSMNASNALHLFDDELVDVRLEHLQLRTKYTGHQASQKQEVGRSWEESWGRLLRGS